jgi:type IV pilus assembly protein PilF
MMTRANLLVVAAIISILCGCVSSTTQTRNYEPSDDAAEQNYQLGAQYFRKGNYDLARDRLLRAIEFDPKLARAHSMLALTYVQLGNTRLATESFDEAVRYGPNNQDVRNAYAVFLCGQGNFDEARKQFDRAIGVRENDNRCLHGKKTGSGIGGTVFSPGDTAPAELRRAPDPNGGVEAPHRR